MPTTRPTTHPRPVADLIAANPEFDWPAFLEILGVADQETVVVTEEAYLDAIDTSSTPPIWRRSRSI